MPGPQISIPNFMPPDLKDPKLYKLNQTFQFVYSKLGLLWGAGGLVNLGSNLEVASLLLASGSTIPTDPSSALSLGAAEALFGKIRPSSGISQGPPGPAGAAGPTGPAGASIALDASQYCGGGGLTQTCVNNAMAALPAGGGAIWLKAGTWAFSAPATCNIANVVLFGDGPGTIISRTGTMPTGQGMFDVTASNVQIENMQINGQVTSPVALQYNTAGSGGFYVTNPETGGNTNYPLANTLTVNTSIWVHGGANNFTADSILFTQGGGYGVLFDASATSINYGQVLRCLFSLNKGNLFGVSPGDLTYGSWTNGVFYCGGTYQGGAGTLSFVSNLTIANNKFYGNNGNCVWGYSPQLYVLHQGISVIGNHFQDCGLDAVEPGASQGVTVEDNTFYRIGYINGSPHCLLATAAVAIDSSGYVRNATYKGNVIFQANGEGIDLDGFTDGSVSGNSIINSDPSDPYYQTDEVYAFLYGIKGINSNNTFSLRGGRNVSITGNTIRNMNYNAISVFNNRNSIVSGNNVIHHGLALSGVVSTSGTAVTWVSGSQFPADIVGFQILINGSPYTVATVPSLTSMTVTSSAGTQVDVSWTVNGGTPVNLANNVLTGTVNTSGTAVTWVSGDKFDTDLDGTYTSGLFLDNGYLYITINNIQFQIASVTSATALVLATSSGAPQSGVTFNLGKLQNNTVTANSIFYDGDNVCIYEDTAYGPNYGPNYIYNNKVMGRQNVGEVGLSTSTSNSSRTQIILSTNTPFTGGPLSQSILQREGISGTGATKIYSTETNTSLFQLNDTGPILNISSQFGASGAYTVGNRTTLSTLIEYVYTGKSIVDGYAVYGMYNNNTLAYNAEFNTLDDSWGGIRYRRPGGPGTGGLFEQSVSASGGIRVWTPIGGGSSGVAGLDTQVQYNNMSAFGADGNLVWNYGATSGGHPAQALKITGGTGASAYPALYVTDSNSPHTAYVSSDGGFVTSSTNATNAIQAPNGGMLAQYLTLATPSPTNTAYPTIILTLNGASVFGRVFGSVITGAAGTAAMSANLYYDGAPHSPAGWYADSGSVNTAMIYMDPGSTTPIVHYVGAAGGSGIGTPALQIYQNGNVGIQGAPTATAGIALTVTGTSAVAGIVLTGGYMQAAQGFFSPYNSEATINAPSGGANLGLAVQLGPNSTSTPLGTPGSSFGGLAFKSGSIYWYYNNTGLGSWNTVDFSSIGSTAAGSDTQIQINESNAFGATANLTFTYGATNPLLTVIGSPGFAVIAAAGGYIQSAQGFLCPSGTSAATINAPAGGANIGLAVQLGPLGSAPATPGSSFGGLAFKTGSTYWYYNRTTPAWASIDLATLAVPGADTDVIYNKANVYGADAHFTWSYSGQLLTIAGSGTGNIALQVNTGYINSVGGFATAATNFNAIQAPGGGVLAANATLSVASPTGTNYPIISLATSATAKGRITGPINNTTGQMLLSANAFFNTTSSQWTADATSQGVAVIQVTSLAANPGNAFTVYTAYPTSNPVTLVPAIQVYNNGNTGLMSTPSSTAGQVLTVGGTSAVAGIILTGGYMQSAQGFFSGYNSAATINAPSGGANIGLAVQLGPLGSSPATPGASFGGLAYNTGSTYWYWNGGSWGTFNFAAAGSPVTSVTGGTGVTASPTTGAVVVSIGQSVATTANVTFLGVSITNALFNSFQTVGSLSIRTGGANLNDLTSNSVVVIDNLHTFVGSGGINTTGTATVAGVVSSGGIQALGYNVTGGFVGQNWTINFASGFTISSVTFHNLIVKGGVIVSAS